MLPKDSKAFQFSTRDLKSIGEYILWCLGIVLVVNATALVDFLNLYLSNEAVTLIILILTIVTKKFVTDYSKE